MQRYLWGVIGQSDRAMTFAEIAARAFPEGSFEADMARALGGSNVARVRSLRRALRKLCNDGVLLAIGEGGRHEPHRYCLDPVSVAMTGDKEDYAKANAVVEADSEASKAANSSRWVQAFIAHADKS
jgi:hypothetical protein